MSVLTIQAISGAGLNPAYSAASAGGDKVPTSAADRTFIHVKNGGASAVTVTIPAQTSQYRGRTIPDRTVSVPASGERMIGPLDAQIDADINGQATVNYSAVTSVTVAAIRI